jgi:hypothetical protein
VNFAIKAVLILQIVGLLFGIYNESAPASWPLRYLPHGMGLSVALIAAAMSMVLLVLDTEQRERAQNHEGVFFRQLARRMSASIPFHEREFYAIWPEQVKRASDTVDVTHLSPWPPRLLHGQAEGDLFSDLKRLYRTATAQVRRVERLTEAKRAWIGNLVRHFEGLPNVSLAIYRDPVGAEMPSAMSICRVDNHYAWLIAIAEHESTGAYRDVLLTGAETVDLLRRYFQDRIWQRSTVIVNRGVVVDGWEQELARE